MLHWRRTLLTALLTSLTFAQATLAADRITLPDPATGQINGRVAILFWPGRLPARGSTAQSELLSADDCEVHLVPHSDLNVELKYQCGEWFQPKAGGYNAWVERGDAISPSPKVIQFPDAPFSGRGMAVVDMVGDAGRVRIPANHSLPSHESLRLLSVDSYLARGGRSRAFDRRVSGANARTGVRVPAGLVVAGRFDRKAGEALAIARPAAVGAGKTIEVWPVPPRNGGDVLAIIEKPSSARSADEAPKASVALRQDQDMRRPDVVIDSFERVVAIWYAVPPGRATAELNAPAFFWRSDVTIREGRVLTLRDRGRPAPVLHASINLLSGSLPASPTLEIARASDGAAVRRLPARAGAQDIESLPMEPLSVTLQLGDWRFTRGVDLSEGRDAIVSFDLQPIEVRGRVFWGDEAAPARLQFKNGSRWVSVKTDERGDYQTVLWRPGTYLIRVELDGKSLPPFTDPFRQIERGGVADFHVPKTDYRVHVFDATDKRDVAGARVSVGNVWISESNAEGTLSERLFTDASGEVTLPPMRAGKVQIDVTAPGYHDAEPIEFVRGADDETRRLDVSLRPVAATSRLRVRLPDGAPAAHAELWAFTDLSSSPRWRGEAGADGGIEIPSTFSAGVILVRHPAAATAVEHWTGRSGEEVDLILARPGAPLAISTARSARIALWIGDFKLSGVPLAFATWSAIAADAAGTWVARNLPARSTRVLAATMGSATSVDAGILDPVAVSVTYPWPALVSVPVSP